MMLHSETIFSKRRAFRLLASPSLVVSALLTAPPVQAATYFVTIGAFDGTVLIEETQRRCLPFDGECLDGSPGSIASLAVGQDGMSAFALASSQQVLRASGTGSWQGQPPGGPPSAGATALIVDRFMLVDPSGTHTEGQMSIKTLLMGSLNEVRGSSTFSASAALCEFVFTGSYGCLETNRSGNVHLGAVSGDPPSGWLPSGVGPVPFNTMLELRWSLVAYCGYVYDFGNCAANFGQSAYWGGITILDGSGQPIPGVQLVSESNVDWLAASPLTPVPAPASAWLLLSGLAVLGSYTRRRAATRNNASG